jgi:hypothetical protein
MINAPFLRSAELRWFLPVTTNQWGAFFDWFSQDRIILNEDELSASEQHKETLIMRENKVTHAYLLLPDANCLGIKKRKDELEMKMLLSTPSAFLLPKFGVTGYMDQWLKWTNNAQQKKLTAEFARTGLWVEVIKERVLQTFANKNEQLTPALGNRHRETGCTVELAHLSCTLNNKDWLSFAFETFGANIHSIDLLSKTVDSYFQDHGQPPLELNFRNALNYPNWLAQLSLNKK